MRERGVMVEVLDYQKLAEACAEHGLGAPRFGGNALLRRASDGAAVVLSYEGVATTKIEPGRAVLDTADFEWKSLPVDAVEACRTGESVDLADHIRTFGSRLDANHWSWYQWATGGER